MDFPLPEIGEGLYEAELVKWLVQPGDVVRRGQPLAEILTDKASMEVPSPFVGKISDLRAAPGGTIRVGEVILTYGEAKEAAAANQQEPARAVEAVAASAPTRPPAPRRAPPTTDPRGHGTPRAAPSVRLLARELGLDLTQVPGSGPGGRILVSDLTQYVQTFHRDGDAAPPPRPAEPRPDYGTPGTRVKLAGLRRKIAEHMVLAKRTIPHYSYVDECDVTDLVRLREMLKDSYAQMGVKLTYLAFVIKAVARALREVPIVNASLDDTAGEIVLHDKYHVGFAAATPGGLIVPVVRDADQKDLAQIAGEIERLSAAARQGKAKLEDLRGGTFTVTSIGNVGGLISTPVINHPEVGILGIGKIVKRPVYDAQMNLRPADVLYLSFSFDHRVVDGAVGAVFANAVLAHLRKPATLLLNGPATR